MKVDRGLDKGKYVLVQEYESLQTRNKYWPTEEGPQQMLWLASLKPVLRIYTRCFDYLDVQTRRHSDYVPVAP